MRSHKVKRISLAIPLLGIILAQPAAAAPRLNYTPQGSFLNYRAATVNELVYQASRSAEVRARYARHFGVKPDRIPPYLRTLKLTALKSPARLQSWHYDKNGKYQTRTENFPKGTLVFAGMDGKPVLSWSCGNPLSRPNVELALKQYDAATKKSAAVVAKTAAQPAVVAAKPETEPTQPIETKVLANEPEIVTAPPVEIASDPTATVAEATEAAALPLPEPLVVAQLPDIIAVPAAVAATASTTGISGGLGALPYLGGLAGIVGGIMLAGGGSSDGPPPPSPPVTIPEPSAVAALAAGLIGLAGMFGRRAA
jgi:hypothetical protein